MNSIQLATPTLSPAPTPITSPYPSPYRSLHSLSTSSSSSPISSKNRLSFTDRFFLMGTSPQTPTAQKYSSDFFLDSDLPPPSPKIPSFTTHVVQSPPFTPSPNTSPHKRVSWSKPINSQVNRSNLVSSVVTSSLNHEELGNLPGSLPVSPPLTPSSHLAPIKRVRRSIIFSSDITSSQADGNPERLTAPLQTSQWSQSSSSSSNQRIKHSSDTTSLFRQEGRSLPKISHHSSSTTSLQTPILPLQTSLSPVINTSSTPLHPPLPSIKIITIRFEDWWNSPNQDLNDQAYLYISLKSEDLWSASLKKIQNRISKYRPLEELTLSVTCRVHGREVNYTRQIIEESGSCRTGDILDQAKSFAFVVQKQSRILPDVLPLPSHAEVRPTPYSLTTLSYTFQFEKSCVDNGDSYDLVEDSDSDSNSFYFSIDMNASWQTNVIDLLAKIERERPNQYDEDNLVLYTMDGIDLNKKANKNKTAAEVLRTINLDVITIGKKKS